MADDSFYWFNAMQGETHLLMVQDADHSMSTGQHGSHPPVHAAPAVFAPALLAWRVVLLFMRKPLN